MSVPLYVFIDTNVLRSQRYNFESTMLATFAEAAKSRELVLLLPDPIDREVKRHLKEFSSEAIKALSEARNSAPFLKKWDHYPTRAFVAFSSLEADRVALLAWFDFLKQFKVSRLGYEGVALPTLMDWFDRTTPTFGPGAKRKEFPDALTVLILDDFVKRNGAIAVVSDDQDIRRACQTRPDFLYFNSLPRFTELLVAGDEAVDKLRESILGNLEKVEKALIDEAANIQYYHRDDEYKIDDSEITSLEIDDIRIAALGHSEATLHFEATVESSHRFTWEEQQYDDQWVVERGTFLDTSPINGTIKVELDPKTQRIAEVTYLDLEESGIRITETPRFR